MLLTLKKHGWMARATPSILQACTCQAAFARIHNNVCATAHCLGALGLERQLYISPQHSTLNMGLASAPATPLALQASNRQAVIASLRKCPVSAYLVMRELILHLENARRHCKSHASSHSGQALRQISLARAHLRLCRPAIARHLPRPLLANTWRQLQPHGLIHRRPQRLVLTLVRPPPAHMHMRSQAMLTPDFLFPCRAFVLVARRKPPRLALTLWMLLAYETPRKHWGARALLGALLTGNQTLMVPLLGRKCLRKVPSRVTLLPCMIIEAYVVILLVQEAIEWQAVQIAVYLGGCPSSASSAAARCSERLPGEWSRVISAPAGTSRVSHSMLTPAGASAPALLSAVATLAGSAATAPQHSGSVPCTVCHEC